MNIGHMFKSKTFLACCRCSCKNNLLQAIDQYQVSIVHQTISNARMIIYSAYRCHNLCRWIPGCSGLDMSRSSWSLPAQTEPANSHSESSSDFLRRKEASVPARAKSTYSWLVGPCKCASQKRRGALHYTYTQTLDLQNTDLKEDVSQGQCHRDLLQGQPQSLVCFYPWVDRLLCLQVSEETK